MFVAAVTTAVYAVALGWMAYSFYKRAESARQQREAADEDQAILGEARDSDTLSRNRTDFVAAMREIERTRAARRVRFAASLVTEVTRCRFILAPALLAVTAIAFAVGGPLLGASMAGMCALMALVPLAARAWLNSVAEQAVSSADLSSNEPLFVPTDWR